VALLQNGYRDASSGVRYSGAGVSNNAYPAALHGNWARTSRMRNVNDGEGISEPLAGIPDGARNEYAWLMPRTAGALAARNTIAGAGAHTGAIAGGVNGEASLTGEGTLTGVGALIVSLVAALTGSGTITNAAAVGFLQLAASLAGAGDFAGAASALASAASALSGSGTATATIRATGQLASAIVVTGDLLNTANAGRAVWASVLEAGYTAEQILRVLAAAVAGESSGAPDGPIVFTGLDGVTDRITGDVDGQGNRSNVVLAAD
jgi:hypothetical protein